MELTPSCHTCYDRPHYERVSEQVSEYDQQIVEDQEALAAITASPLRIRVRQFGRALMLRADAQRQEELRELTVEREGANSPDDLHVCSGRLFRDIVLYHDEEGDDVVQREYLCGMTARLTYTDPTEDGWLPVTSLDNPSA